MEFCIIGSGRCGSTAMRSILNTHPDVFVINESHWIPKMIQDFGSAPVDRDHFIDVVLRTNHFTGGRTQEFDVDDFINKVDMPDNLSVRDFCDTLGHYFAASEGKSKYADKTPDYGPFIKSLSNVWPQCRFIHLIRDGRAVVRSMLGHGGYRALLSSGAASWCDVAYDYHPDQGNDIGEAEVGDMAALWAERVRLTRAAGSQLSTDQYLEVRYEALTQNPAAILSEITAFCGLSMDDAWLQKAAAQIKAPATTALELAEIEAQFPEQARSVLVDLGYTSTAPANGTKIPSTTKHIDNRTLALADRPSNLPISRKIRTIAISMVKNERDIMEPFLRHNHVFFDAMIVIDNCSSDGTRDILHACAKELGNIVFCERPEFAYHQSQYTTLVTRFIQSIYRSDFIVFLDADEFISAKDRATFETSIATIPPRGTGMMRWETYLPDPQLLEDSAPDPMPRIKRRRKAELPQFFKSILRLDGEMLPVIVEQGAHNISDMQTQVPLPSVILDDLPLIHIPVRSQEQLMSKSVIGWVANVARDPKNFALSEGFQWRNIFEKVVHQQAHFSNAEVCLEALRYAQDDRDFSIAADTQTVEPPVNTARKYSDGAFGSVLGNVAAAFLSNVLHETNVADAQIDTAPVPDLGNKEPRAPGVFDDSWHHEKIFVDRPPFEYLAQKYAPNAVLDVGCGAGWYLKLLAEFGVDDIQGVDGISSEAVVIDPRGYRKVDLHEPLDFGKTFDLVMCIEVLEHLNPKATQILFDGLAKHAGKTILFSVAEPDQPGVDHINCIPMSQVLKEWKTRGWAPDLYETFAVRGLSTLSWLRRNLLVLKPIAQIDDASEAIAELERIGAEKFDWYGQNPGVRTYAFHEAFPETTPEFDANLADPMPKNESPDLIKLLNEREYLRASLRHAKRYPWKYLKGALTERRKSHRD